MPALTEKETLAVLRFRMQNVKDGAGIDADDPFSLVLDTTVNVLDATLQAAWRSREGHEKASADLRRATADLNSTLNKLEKKIDRGNERAALTQKRSSDIFMVYTVVVAICVAACLATVLRAPPSVSACNNSCAAPDDANTAPNDRPSSDSTGGERAR